MTMAKSTKVISLTISLVLLGNVLKRNWSATAQAQQSYQIQLTMDAIPRNCGMRHRLDTVVFTAKVDLAKVHYPPKSVDEEKPLLEFQYRASEKTERWSRLCSLQIPLDDVAKQDGLFGKNGNDLGCRVEKLERSKELVVKFRLMGRAVLSKKKVSAAWRDEPMDPEVKHRSPILVMPLVYDAVTVTFQEGEETHELIWYGMKTAKFIPCPDDYSIKTFRPKRSVAQKNVRVMEEGVFHSKYVDSEGEAFSRKRRESSSGVFIPGEGFGRDSNVDQKKNLKLCVHNLLSEEKPDTHYRMVIKDPVVEENNAELNYFESKHDWCVEKKQAKIVQEHLKKPIMLYYKENLGCKREQLLCFKLTYTSTNAKQGESDRNEL